MFTPDVRFQYALFSPLACLIVIGAAYICQKLIKSCIPRWREKRKKKKVSCGCSIMQLIRNQGHRRTHTAASSPHLVY